MNGFPEAFIEPLAGHFHQADGGDLQYLGLGLVALQAVLHGFVHGLLVLPMAHVDEVHHHQAADVAQAELSGDFIGGFQVGVQNGLVQVLGALVAPGVHVNGDQGFRLVNHQVAAAGQEHLALEGFVDLFFNPQFFKDGRAHGEVLDVALGATGDFSRNGAHVLRSFRVVADDVVHGVRQEVPCRAFDQVGFPVHADGGGVGLLFFLHAVPLLQQHGEVADKVAVALSLGHRAHDDAHAVRHVQLLHDLAQAQAFLGVFNLAGDAELVREGHQDQVASRQGDVCGDAGALGADRALGDLHHDFGADGVDVRNVLGRDFALLLLWPSFAFDFFQAGVQRGGQSVPEVEEGVLFLADVHEHGLEARFDVFDAALEDAAYDVVFAFALDGVFFQYAVFQKGYAAFEFLGIDDDGGAFHGITGSEAEGSFNFFKHFCKHGV